MYMSKIIKGYKGIMDLDLTHIRHELHAELIKQHLLDIKLYKEQQLLLPEELRYDNTIGKIMKNREFFERICAKKAQEKLDETNQRFRELCQRYS